MKLILDQFRDFFSSLRLTVALLVLSIILVFVATLDQVNLGIWAVQEKYFQTFFVMKYFPGSTIPIPVFPGGYTIGGMLLINLVLAHFERFKPQWRKAGISLTHAGIVLLLVGELFTGLFSDESHMRLDEGGTKNFSESFLKREVAVIETTESDFDIITSIPIDRIARSKPVDVPELPFVLRVREGAFYPNSALAMRGPNMPQGPSIANAGIGPQIAVTPMRPTYKPDEVNVPSMFVDITGRDGASLGTWLLSTMLSAPQELTVGARKFRLDLRPTRFYKDFNVTLIDFTHDKYPGTQIPKNFSSKVRVLSDDRSVDRETLIYMNNPLRHGGFTFYQSGFDNNDTTSVLQVVQNPGWFLPYAACALVTLGLLIQFGIHLKGFIARRYAKKSEVTP
ncbi:MAG TPA: cytochrome c biogenesis protein ResB [Opitutaceae bacterium]|nr:cytochrome c biogenesis protein ResB [Opitutaceae bacterium]